MTAALRLTASEPIALIVDLDRSPSECQRRIDAIVACHGDRCEDGVLRDYAEAVFCAGRAAFYSKAGYHFGFAGVLANTANVRGDAVSAMRAEFRPHQHYLREKALDCLIPLNRAGAESLVEAYDIIGLYREADELEARRLQTRGL